VELAEKHNFPQIHALLTKYASNLLENSGIQGKINAVELYRKAGKSVEAASILTELATDAATKGNLVRAKKFQVLAALEVETFRQRTLNSNNNTGSMTTSQGETKESKVGGPMTAQQTLAGLMTLETAVTSEGSVMANAKAMDNAWRGAEAYHFEILAHKLLYRNKIELAMECAKELVQYDDILDPKRVYALLALTAFYNERFSSCSNAFVKLESLEGLSSEERRVYQNLAMSIFTQNHPSRHDHSDIEDRKRSKFGRQRLCIVSGRPLRVSKDDQVMACKRCRHFAFESEIVHFKTCVLCHAPVSSFR
jgi:WD repeat-containing protein 35